MGRCTEIWDKDEYSFYAKGIYCLLAKFANKEGECWPSTRKLSKLAKLSRPTVIKAIEELEAGGAIIVTRQKTNFGDNDNNRYVLPDLIHGEGGKGDLPRGKQDLPPVVNGIDHGGKGDLPGVVNDVDHNYTNITIPLNLSNTTNKDIYVAPGGDDVLFAPAEIEEVTSGAQERDCAKTAPSIPEGIGAPTVEKAAGKGDEYTKDFLAFWEVYPRKEGKIKAFRAWKTTVKALRKSKIPVDSLITAAKRYATKVEGNPTKFMKLPSTFLGPDKPFEEFIGDDYQDDKLVDNPVDRTKTGNGLINSRFETTREKAARLAKHDCPHCKGAGTYTYTTSGIPDLANPGKYVIEPETRSKLCDCWKPNE